MTEKENKDRYFELMDAWSHCKAEADKLQAEVTKAFANVMHGTGGNPSSALLDMLESLRSRQQRLWDEMQKILNSI